jgi:catechol 2,3-dioxygenase-like lactoylglutathione lyase family enzyme
MRLEASVFEDIGSLAVYVSDKERAQQFYVGKLGFKVEFDLGPQLCFLKSANGRIHVYLEGGKQPANTGKDSCRLGFYLRTREPARQVFDRLRAAGVRTVEDEPEQVSADTACFGLYDPDGSIVEVSGPA